MPPEEPGTSPQTPAGEPQTPPAPPPASPAAPDPGTPPAPPTVPPPSNQIDGDIARRFDTERGRWQQYSSDVASWQGGMQQQLSTMQALLNDRVARVQALEAEIATLQEQLGRIPDLEQQASQVTQIQGQLDRLTQITAFPEIVNRVQVRQEEQEDGTTQEVRENPLLSTLMSSTLTGEQFMRNLQGVVASLGTGQSPPPSEPQTAPNAGMTPAPVAPTPVDDFWAQYNEAQAGGDHARMMELLQERAVQMDQT